MPQKAAVRAFVECSECIRKQPDYEKVAAELAEALEAQQRLRRLRNEMVPGDPELMDAISDANTKMALALAAYGATVAK